MSTSSGGWLRVDGADDGTAASSSSSFPSTSSLSLKDDDDDDGGDDDDDDVVARSSGAGGKKEEEEKKRTTTTMSALELGNDSHDEEDDDDDDDDDDDEYYDAEDLRLGVEGVDSDEDDEYDEYDDDDDENSYSSDQYAPSLGQHHLAGRTTLLSSLLLLRPRAWGNNWRTKERLRCLCLSVFASFAIVAFSSVHYYGGDGGGGGGGSSVVGLVGHEGYDALHSSRIVEFEGRLTLYRHRATGAEFLAYVPDSTRTGGPSPPSSNNNGGGGGGGGGGGDDDGGGYDPKPDKVFGIAFRTKPESSTGVPHILEREFHLVLVSVGVAVVACDGIVRRYPPPAPPVRPYLSIPSFLRQEYSPPSTPPPPPLSYLILLTLVCQKKNQNDRIIYPINRNVTAKKRFGPMRIEKVPLPRSVRASPEGIAPDVPECHDVSRSDGLPGELGVRVLVAVRSFFARIVRRVFAVRVGGRREGDLHFPFRWISWDCAFSSILYI